MPTFIKALPVDERAPAYVNHQAFIRGRNFAKGEAESALTHLAGVHPELSRLFFKSLRALEGTGTIIRRIENLDQLLGLPTGVIRRTVADRDLLRKCVSSRKRLDFKRAKLDKIPTYIDVTLQFEEIQIIKESYKALFEFDREQLSQDSHLALVVLYDCLLDVSDVMVLAGGDKGVGKLERDPTEYGWGRAQIIMVKEFLKDILGHFPWDRFSDLQGIISNPHHAEKQGIVELLEAGNNGAAEPKFDKLLREIEARLENIEAGEARRAKKTRFRKSRNPLQEEILHLAQRKYKIEFSEGGVWLIPQEGYREREGFKVRETIPHHVPEEAVLRRSRHIIDNITREIAFNLESISLFEGFTDRFRSGRVNFNFAVAEIDKAYEEYKSSIVRPKKEVRSRLLRALRQLMKAQRPGRSFEAQGRLLRNAATMLAQSSSYLKQRVENLSRQLQFLQVKHQVEETIITGNLRREANLRSTANRLFNALRINRVVWTPAKLAELQDIVKSARVEIKGATEPGLKRCDQRLKDLFGLIGKIRRLVINKYRLMEDFQRFTNNFKIKKGELEAGSPVVIEGRRVNMDQLRELYLKEAAERIRKVDQSRQEDNGLTWHVQAIKQTLLLALREAHLITFDLEHKFEEAEPKPEDLKAIAGVLAEIESRDTDLVMAVSKGRDPQPLGEILKRDAVELKLRFAPLPVWERYLRGKQNG